MPELELHRRKLTANCGHCGKSIVAEGTSFSLWEFQDQDKSLTALDVNGTACWRVTGLVCSNIFCRQAILYLNYARIGDLEPGRPVYPPPSVAADDIKLPCLEVEGAVPENIRKCWDEAQWAVKNLPMMGGLIVRACLDKVLRAKGYGDPERRIGLKKVVEEARDDLSSDIPEARRESLFGVALNIAEIGNSAAHDEMPVGSAENHMYSLKTVGDMIDYYYGEPAKRKSHQEAGQSRHQLKDR